MLGWIAEIAASQVSDRKGNAFIVEKIVKKYFVLFSLLFKHLALLSIEIIDSLDSLSTVVQYFLRFNFHATHNLDIKTKLPFGCLQTKDGG